MGLHNRHPSALRGLLAAGPATLLAAVLAAAGCGDSGTDPSSVDHGHDHETAEGHCGHLVGSGVVLTDGPTTLVSSWNDQQTGALELRVGDVLSGLRVHFLDQDSVAFAVADNCPENALDYTIGHPERLALERDPGVTWTFRLRGLQAGTTTLTLRGMHENHSHLGTQPIPVTVLPPPTDGLSITGVVRLRTLHTDDFGEVIDDRTIDDATGVRAILRAHGGPDIGSTVTDAGRYRFDGLAAGAYRLRFLPLEVAGPGEIEIALEDTDVEVPTHTLGPNDLLRTYPNPFPYDHGVGIEFTPVVPQSVEIRALSLGGALVWAYAFEAPAAFMHIHWIGTDQDNNPMPPGPYWIAVRHDETWHTRLVLKLPE